MAYAALGKGKKEMTREKTPYRECNEEPLPSQEDKTPSQDDVVQRKLRALEAEETADEVEETEEHRPLYKEEQEAEETPQNAAAEEEEDVAPEVDTAILLVRYPTGRVDVVTDLANMKMKRQANANDVYSMLHEINEAGSVSRIASAVQQTIMPQVKAMMQQAIMATMAGGGVNPRPGGKGFRPGVVPGGKKRHKK